MSVERVSPQKLKLALLSARSYVSSSDSTSPCGRGAGTLLYAHTTMLKSGAKMSSAHTARTSQSFNSPPRSHRAATHRQHSPPACLEFLPLAGMLRLKLTTAQKQQPVPKSLSSARYHHALNAATSDYLNDLSVLAEACRRGDKPQAESRARLAAATTYEQLGLWEHAIEHFTHYLDVSQTLADVDAQALALNRIGICHLKADGSAVALAARCHRTHLKLATGNEYARFVAYTNLGLLYQEKYAIQKKELDEKRKKHKHRAEILTFDRALKAANEKDMSLGEASTAPLRKALVCHQKALDAALEDYARESETIAVANLSVVNFQLEDWTAAFGLAERCLKLTKQLQNVSYRIRAMHNVAVATHMLSLSTTAREEAEKRRDLAEKARALFLEAGRMAHEAVNGGDIAVHGAINSGGISRDNNSVAGTTARNTVTVPHAAAVQLEELAARCRHSVAIAAVAPIDVDTRLAELVNGGHVNVAHEQQHHERD